MIQTHRTALLSITALVAALGVAGAGLADSPKKDNKESEQQAIRAAVSRGEVLPLTRILTLATQKVPGEVIKVELERETSGFKYEVKILTATGRVREVELDAKTGALIKIEND